MAQRLQVQLLPNWARMDNPDGPATFYRTDSEDSGALQVSLYAEYAGGKIPNPSVDDLIELAQGHGERHEAGELVETSGGTCGLGVYGSAVFRSAEYPYFRLWYISNGRDFVLATHICTAEPDAIELAEAQQIVEMVGLSA